MSQVLRWKVFWGVACLVAAAGCKRPSRSPAPFVQAKAPPEVPPGSVHILAAGDIASCKRDSDDATARVLDRFAGTVLTLGDHVYPSGTAEEFRDCYGPSWGRHRDRTRPSPGNHDYRSPRAAPYYEFFGDKAGDPSKGYYAFKLGAWKILSLNSNCDEVQGGCGPDSPQVTWLKEELAKDPTRCTLAYWHHPRYSSGRSSEGMADIFRALYDGSVDVVLAGHDHHYERFAPMDPEGKPDKARGIRTFIVGTGGMVLYKPHNPPLPMSEVWNTDTFGVLDMTLEASGYTWRFIPIEGQTFEDLGSEACH